MIALTNPSTDKKGKWTKLQKEERYKMAPDRIIIFWDNIIFWHSPHSNIVDYLIHCVRLIENIFQCPPDVQKSCWPWKCGLARIFVLISANCVGSVLLQHSHVLYVSWWVSPANCLGSVLLQPARPLRVPQIFNSSLDYDSHCCCRLILPTIPLWIMRGVAVQWLTISLIATVGISIIATVGISIIATVGNFLPIWYKLSTLRLSC